MKDKLQSQVTVSQRALAANQSGWKIMSKPYGSCGMERYTAVGIARRN